MELLVMALLVAILIAVQARVYKKHIFDKLGYRCKFSEIEAHEGDYVFLVESVHNRKLLPIPWLKVDMTVSCWLEFEETKPIENLEKRYLTSGYFLKSYQKTTRRWRVKCLKRGLYEIDKVTVVAGDFIGINVESVPVQVNAAITVYPATINLEEMLASVNYLQGSTIVKRWVIDDPFVISGAREYRPSDPLNRIHWSATARTGFLMTRKNDFTSYISLSVVLNIQSLEYETDWVVEKETIELGIKAAATLLDRALSTGIPARLAANASRKADNDGGIFTGEAAGKDHISGLLKLLAELQLKKAKDIEVFLEAVSGNISNSQVVFITSFINDRILDSLRRIKEDRNHVRVIMLNKVQQAEIPQDIELYYITGDGR